MTYQISDNGIQQIKLRECNKDDKGNPICDLEAYAATKVEAAKGKYTIAYGNTFYPDGSPVKKGDKITQKQADTLFTNVIQHYVDYLNPLLLHVILNQNQFDAITSLVYNIGKANFVNSTMLRLLHQGQIAQAGQQFTRWIYQNKVIVNELIIRRKLERDQFFTQV